MAGFTEADAEGRGIRLDSDPRIIGVGAALFRPTATFRAMVALADVLPNDTLAADDFGSRAKWER